MKILGPHQTIRLWDRLRQEARSYYGTLHSLQSDLRLLGPCEDTKKRLSDLVLWRRRLKHRFTVMVFIGRGVTIGKETLSDAPQFSQISDLALECADQVIGLGVIQEILKGVR